VNAAKDNEVPPPELLLAWQCNRFGCLPEAGGYNDQDVIIMERMGVYDKIYNFEKRWRSMEKRDYATLSENDRAMFMLLKNQGIKF